MERFRCFGTRVVGLFKGKTQASIVYCFGGGFVEFEGGDFFFFIFSNFRCNHLGLCSIVNGFRIILCSASDYFPAAIPELLYVSFGKNEQT